jgi:hypothetical protein
MLPELANTLSALQSFGQKLGLVGPQGDRTQTPARGPREAPPDPVDEPGDALPVFEPAPRALRSHLPTTVYGFKADLKAVKAPDEVLGHSLNTLV